MPLAPRPRDAVTKPLPSFVLSLMLGIGALVPLGLTASPTVADGSVIARDSFSRNTAGSLGTADQGGVYVTDASGAALRVANGQGLVSLDRKGAVVRAMSPSVQSRNVLVGAFASHLAESPLATASRSPPCFAATPTAPAIRSGPESPRAGSCGSRPCASARVASKCSARQARARPSAPPRPSLVLETAVSGATHPTVQARVLAIRLTRCHEVAAHAA